jgi:hypothetical protein
MSSATPSSIFPVFNFIAPTQERCLPILADLVSRWQSRFRPATSAWLSKALKYNPKLTGGSSDYSEILLAPSR